MADASQEELRTLTWRSEKTMRMADELKIAQQRVHELEDQVDDLSSTLNSLLGRPVSPAASRASLSQTALTTSVSSPPRKGASLSASSSSALRHMTVALGPADEKLSLEELMTGNGRHAKSEDKTSIDIAALVAATDEQGHAARHPEGKLTQVAGVTKQEPIASSAAALRRGHAEQETEDGVEVAVEQEVSAERLAEAVAAEYIRAGSARFGFARVASVVEPESVQALEARVSDLRERVASQPSPRESLQEASLDAQQTSDRPTAEGVVGHGSAGGQGQTEVEERQTDVGKSGCRGLQGLDSASDDDRLRLQSSFGQRLQAAFSIGLHQLPPSATTSSDEHLDSALSVLDQDIQRLEHENVRVAMLTDDEKLSRQEEVEGVTGDTGEDEDEDSLALLLRYSQGGCDPWELGADEDSDKRLEGEWGPCHELATVDEESQQDEVEQEQGEESADCVPETESLERGDDKQMVLEESIHGDNERMLMAQFEVEHARGSVTAHPLT